jgi:hypothetical protein
MVMLRLSGAWVLLLATLLWKPVLGAPSAEKVSGGQRAAALEFLSAVAGGDPQAVAFALHPDDLQALRLRVLTLLRDEAKHGAGTIRSRLFGQGMPLDEIERLTNTGFYATLASKLYLTGREYSEVEGVAAIPDKGDRVQVVVRGRQPRDHGKVEVVNVVTLRPYGKDWKATLPGRCDEYYAQRMSPNFRRVTGKNALQALVTRCQNSMGTRQLLLSTLHMVRGLAPRYENENQRAVYALSGQGLPFQTFSLEQVDRHWFIAE